MFLVTQILAYLTPVMLKGVKFLEKQAISAIVAHPVVDTELIASMSINA